MPGIGNELTSKFVRSHFVNQSVSNTTAIRWFHKLVYEFWGFCVNGGTSLTVPGGIAPLSGVLMPSGFESGSTTLLASGSDGVTIAGQHYFSAASVDWTSGSGAYVGKHIVLWKSSSVSSDDSVYQIVQIVNSSTIRVNINQGGTPYSASLKLAFSDRTNVNFRVVDINAAANLAGTADADGLVLQLNGAWLVNSGQIAPQVRTRIRTSVGSNVPNVGLTLSSSGSWTAASSSGYFTDGTAEINATTSANGWGASGTGTGYITLMGAQDYLIAHVKGAWNSVASGFHIEVPQRLYPQWADPNPIVAMNFGNSGVTINTVDQHYAGGVTALHNPDGETKKYQGMVRNITGEYWNSQVFTANAPNGVDTGRYRDLYYNSTLNKVIMHDILLSLRTTATSLSYVAGRLKLRRVRWTGKALPAFYRTGEHGEWLHLQNGVLWPWDNAILPYSPFLGGL